MSDIEFRVLGATEVLADGHALALGSPKQRALLTLLLIHAGEVQSTDRIIDALWGEQPPKGGVKTLRYHVSKLRAALGEHADLVVSHSPGYVLEAPSDAIDSRRFEALSVEAKAILKRDPQRASQICSRALELWRGSPYADFGYQEFVQAEVRRLNELRLSTIELRIQADLEAGQAMRVIPELEALVTEHPLRERFWAQLMTALYRSGRQPDALRAFKRACEPMAEVGTGPSPELIRLEEQILLRDVALDTRAVGQTERAPSGKIPTNLPPERTSLVGREHILEHAGRLLGGCRLLTLTGPPGAGKTRLGIRLAADHSSDFTHGVFLVSLTAATDGDLVEVAIGQALGLKELPGLTIGDVLKSYLEDRQLLLVLDNFEHVVEAAPIVGALLGHAPLIKIVATSRIPLRLFWEQEFPVPPLEVPDPGDSLDADTMSRIPAVSLFAARAHSVDPRFRLDAENAPDVAEITRRLDGLPLAIELAAAQVKFLSPADLLGRMQRTGPVLGSGPVDTVDHHRTLRAAIAWSYELLEPVDRMVFRSLGIFRGFTLEAAEAVVALDGDILNGVRSLVEKSLVHRVEPSAGTRFAMLETLRSFALREASAAAESEELAVRHARFYMRVAEEWEGKLSLGMAETGLEPLVRDLDNIRIALRHAIEGGERATGLRLAAAIWRLWESTGRLSEGRQWLAGLLKEYRPSDRIRARALAGSAGLAYWHGDLEAAWAAYQEALSIYQAIGDAEGEADTLFGMSMTATWKGDGQTGELLALDARQICRSEQLETGRIDMAQAWAMQRRGRVEAARPFWEAALADSRERGDHHAAITQLIGIAANEYHMGNRAQALRIAREALDESVAVDNLPLAVWALDVLAGFVVTTAPNEATRLASAAYWIRQLAGGGMSIAPLGIANVEATGRKLLGPAGWKSAWAEGRGMNLQEAVDCAHDVVARQPPDAAERYEPSPMSRGR